MLQCSRNRDKSLRALLSGGRRGSAFVGGRRRR